MHITLRQLAIFAAVYQHQSTIQAARQLSLSQSAVSSGLAELERQLGVSLFERSSKRLLHNEYAHLSYPKAIALLEQAQELENLFQQGRAIIHIGASTTIGNYLLPRLMAQFRHLHPQVSFKLTVANSREIAEGLVSMAYDLAMIEGHFSHPDLVIEDWQNDELVWFCAAQSQWLPHNKQAPSALTPTQLRQIPLIVRENGSGTRTTLAQWLQQHAPTARIGMELGNSEAIKHAVLEDLGIGCLSHHIVRAELNNGLLYHLPLPPLQRTLWLLRHRQKHINQALSLLLAFLQTR